MTSYEGNTVLDDDFTLPNPIVKQKFYVYVHNSLQYNECTLYSKYSCTGMSGGASFIIDFTNDTSYSDIFGRYWVKEFYVEVGYNPKILTIDIPFTSRQSCYNTNLYCNYLDIDAKYKTAISYNVQQINCFFKASGVNIPSYDSRFHLHISKTPNSQSSI